MVLINVRDQKKTMFPSSSIVGFAPFLPPPRCARGNTVTAHHALPLPFPLPALSPPPPQLQLPAESHFNMRNKRQEQAGFQDSPLGVFTQQLSSNQPLTRPRRNDEHSLYDVKRQRFGSPGIYGRTPQVVSPLPVAQSAPPKPPIEGCRHPPGIHKPKQTGGTLVLRRELCPSIPEDPLILAGDKLSQQILALFQACQQQNDDLEKKERCRAQLQKEIRALFPHSTVYLAGSTLNGFGSRSSDADLCLVIKDGSVDQRTDAVYILSLIRKLLYRLSYIERPQLIRAKVPILKFRDKVSGVEFDLNVNNIVGIRNTFLLRTYAYIESRVRPIILVIKKWARYRGINDASRGTLSSYSLVLMVLHYLQKPVIPCLQKDYPECFSVSMDIHLVPEGPKGIPPFISKNQSTLGDLFLGFLKYYAKEFNWDKLMISVREADALPKPNCREWKNKFICVEEPFDRSNTARAVHEKVKFDAIKAEFTESLRLLQLKKDLNAILPVRATIQER
ncbi:poly(A) RNA polymerase GLD2-like [Scleropages formosus]|uniref:polynucleotide adenylyltransferase n=1 Tax=Scleropages formosus TaxID=113540 RepID=A0A0P7VPE0_SCLFO|nr:poly(A) RNA polymerase GLD2-like [Scleropages formosus]